MASETTDQRVIDRIKKLLIKHDGCKKINSEAEAEIALSLAFEMMKKHHLSMSEVITENANTDQEIFIIEKECEKYIANELPVWIQNLVQLINIVCNTECILRKYKTNRSAKQLYINFVGEEKDVKNCIEMYKFFKGTTLKLSNEHKKKVKGNFTQWRSFSEGFTGRLLERAVSDQNETEEELRRVTPENTGMESIDDMEDFDDCSDEENQSFSVMIRTGELAQINRYKIYVREKIAEFIKKQEANKENLKESSRIDSSSFNQGRIAANRYDLTATQKKVMLLS